MSKKIYNVLWTSGWESTFRVADLILIKGKTVQPFYVIDENRPSTGMEQARMAEIRNQFYSKSNYTEGQLLPTIEYRKSQLPKNKEISASMHRLQQRGFLGSQYNFIATFALHYNMDDLELSIHKNDNAHKFLEGNVNRVTDTEGEVTYQLKEDLGDPPLHTVFNRFLFPILEMTKLEMEAYAQEHDFKEIMENTWFCHRPIHNNQPCGICNPCIYTRKEGLGRRVPTPSVLDKLAYSYDRAIRKFKLMIR